MKSTNELLKELIEVNTVMVKLLIAISTKQKLSRSDIERILDEMEI